MKSLWRLKCDLTQPRWGWFAFWSWTQARRSGFAPTLVWRTDPRWGSSESEICEHQTVHSSATAEARRAIDLLQERRIALISALSPARLMCAGNAMNRLHIHCERHVNEEGGLYYKVASFIEGCPFLHLVREFEAPFAGDLAQYQTALAQIPKPT